MKSAVVICLLAVFCCDSVDSSAQWGFGKNYQPEFKAENFPEPVLEKIRLSSGVQLQYAEQGNESGVPVIFLHGLTDSWHSFENVLALLPSDIHAFAISQRGHGNSDRPLGGYSPADFANDVAEFIQQKNIGAAVIVGHSMGGIVAQRFLLDHPQLAKAVVLIGTDVSFQDNEGMPEFFQEVLNLNDPIERKFMEDFQTSTLAKPIDSSYYNLVVDESMKVPAHVFKAAFRGVMEADFTSNRKVISIPALIFYGDKDAICPRADQSIMKENFKNAKLLMYEGTGHALHWEEPVRFVNDLSKFINGLEISKQSID